MRKEQGGRCAFKYMQSFDAVVSERMGGTEGGAGLSVGTMHPIRRCEASHRRKCRVYALGSLREVVHTQATDIFMSSCFNCVSSPRTFARYRFLPPSTSHTVVPSPSPNTIRPCPQWLMICLRSRCAARRRRRTRAKEEPRRAGERGQPSK
jgi:hypothetical protein